MPSSSRSMNVIVSAWLSGTPVRSESMPARTNSPRRAGNTLLLAYPTTTMLARGGELQDGLAPQQHPEPLAANDVAGQIRSDHEREPREKVGRPPRRDQRRQVEPPKRQGNEDDACRESDDGDRFALRLGDCHGSRYSDGADRGTRIRSGGYTARGRHVQTRSARYPAAGPCPPHASTRPSSFTSRSSRRCRSPPREIDRYTDELARIVGYVEQLDAVDTSDVTPTAHVEIDAPPCATTRSSRAFRTPTRWRRLPRSKATASPFPAFLE